MEIKYENIKTKQIKKFNLDNFLPGLIIWFEKIRI